MARSITKCAECGRRYYTDEGLYIVRPDGWNPMLCAKCNSAAIAEADETARG